MIDQTDLQTIFRNYLISQGASTKTQKNYCADVDDFLSWKRTHTSSQTEEITTQDIQGYVSSLLKEQKTVATVNRRLSSLRVFFRSLTEQRKLGQNPMDGITNLVDPAKAIEKHREVLSVWQEKLRNKGAKQRDIDTHTIVIADFLEWIAEKRNTGK